jgi:L-cysteine desulfidase
MHELTRLIRADMKPALGVTEPGAIAFAVSTARNHLKAPVQKVHLYLNSGIYKNAFTCGIPGTKHIGNDYAAALGVLAADPSKGLLCLEGISNETVSRAEKMVESGMIDVHMTEMSSRIHIEARLEGDGHTAEVLIKDAHTNIICIKEDGVVVYNAEESDAATEADTSPIIHRYSVSQILEYVRTVPLDEIRFIREAVDMNMALCHEGLKSPLTTFSRTLLSMNHGQEFSDDALRTANVICNAAIEARVIGLNKPAMSITGSGAHGIIATLPLYAWVKVHHGSEDSLLRSIALSFLICMYIKEYSGKLSAFCGCAIAAGTGAACALTYLMGGGEEAMQKVINNMASSITGMICDGGNQGCVMKGITAVELAFTSAELAMQDAYIFREHGINGKTPEDTMRNMGLIASPGMVETEKTIVGILQHKDQKKNGSEC